MARCMDRASLGHRLIDGSGAEQDGRLADHLRCWRGPGGDCGGYVGGELVSGGGLHSLAYFLKAAATSPASKRIVRLPNL